MGGDARGLERVTPILHVLGSPLQVGGLGAGSAAKLVANFTLFGVLGVIGEALAAADALGLARERLRDAGGDACRRAGGAATSALEAGEYPTPLALSLARKDAELLADAVDGTNLRLFEAARGWLADAEAAGRGGEDYSSVLAQTLSESERASSRG